MKKRLLVYLAALMLMISGISARAQTTLPVGGLPTSDVTGGTVRYSGSWTWGNIGGHNYALLNGDGSAIDTKLLTGSGTNTLKVTIFSSGSSTPIDVYFDGVVQTRPNIGTTGSWHADVLIASNIPVGTNITIKGVAGLGTFYIDTDYALQITDGTAPTLGPPSNFGPQYDPQASPFTANSRREGGFQNYNGLTYNFFDGPNIDMSLRFYSDATSIRTWSLISAGGGTYEVLQDGVQIVAPTAFPATPVNTGWLTLASGLSGTHEYEIHVSNVGGNGHYLTFYRLMLVGGSSGLVTHSYPARDQYMFLGDSITQASINPSFPDSRNGYVYKFGQTGGVGVVNGGVNSRTSADVLYTLTHAGYPYLGLGSTYLKAWAVLIGTNDISTSVSTATYQANITGIINALQTAYPSAVGYIIKILPRNDAFSSSVGTYNAVLPAAISGATSGGAGVSLIDISMGFNPATMTYDTSLHPTPAGYTILSANLVSTIFPSTIFRRSNGGRAGSRSEGCHYGVSPSIIKQLSQEHAHTR